MSVNTPSAPTRATAAHVKTKVLEAKFERGTWFYLQEKTGAQGTRGSRRWFPSHYFENEELQSRLFGKLRAAYLGEKDSQVAALIAVQDNLGDEPWEEWTH